MANSTAAAPDPLSYWEEPWYLAFQTYIFSWLFPLAMLTGVYGNLTCLLAMLKNPGCFPFSVRLSMLVSCFVDFLLVGGKSITHYLAPSVMGRILSVDDYRTRTSYPVCLVYYSFTIWLLHGSPFIRLGLCYHSMVVILAPLKRDALLCRRNVALYQGLLLAVSFIPCVRLFSSYWLNNRCRFHGDDWIRDFYRFFTLFASRCLVVCILLGTLAVIVLSMRRSQRKLSSAISGGKRGGQTGTVSRIFITTSVIFFVCETPYSVLQFLETFDLYDASNGSKQVSIILNAAMFLNPAFNWLPYLLGRKFRTAYKGLFGCGSLRGGPDATAGTLGSSSAVNEAANNKSRGTEVQFNEANSAAQ